MTKCEVIIVRYGLPELEKECIDSVIEHTTDIDYHLTDHDNYESDEGLAKVWNDLIRDADAKYICLLNNDTRVEKEWLSKLLECFEEDPVIGVMGPMTNSSTGPQGNSKNKTRDKRLLLTRYPLVGFCLVFRKSVWEEVGGFDEGYEIYGEDSDFCMEVRELGYKWAIRTDVFIFHHGKASTSIAIARGKDLRTMKKESKDKYLKKWKRGNPTPGQLEAQRQKEAEAERLAEVRRLVAEERKASRSTRAATVKPPKPPALAKTRAKERQRHDRYLRGRRGK